MKPTLISFALSVFLKFIEVIFLNLLLQILLSLGSTPQDLLAFEEALTKTSSPKEQKQHMRSLLVLAAGDKLKALASQKSVNVITNVTGQ